MPLGTVFRDKLGKNIFAVAREEQTGFTAYVGQEVVATEEDLAWLDCLSSPHKRHSTAADWPGDG